LNYTEPLLFVFLTIAFLGAFQFYRRKRGGYALFVGLAGLFAISWPPLNWLFSRPLEVRYPVRPFQPSGDVQAIVVLGSAAEPPVFERPYPLADRYLYERCEHAAWIYRHRPLPVLASEGMPSTGVVTSESVMRDLLERSGVPANMIWVEAESRSTYENALYGARILRKQGISKIALVVEAESMLRASACFRKQGFEVEAAPSEFREWGHWREELLPTWNAVRSNEIIFHEVLGIVWYRMRGWI
jgi:uncharacterized SAM-binding protein YcdF (DUF218 family)